MKRRILLVDDEVAVLLTLKAVLEISGFDVDTATSAREGKSRIRHREYEMVITDMRMEGERAGEEVIQAAKAAPYKPAVALLTAFPIDEEALSSMGADKMLVKPMHTRQLLQQLEALYVRHHGKDGGKDGDGRDGGKRSGSGVSKDDGAPAAAAKNGLAKLTAKKLAPAKKKTAAAPTKPAAAKKAVKKSSKRVAV